MLVGYARVSTSDQSLDPQLDALRDAGCEKFHTDVVSGAAAERTGLSEALTHIRESDVLVVVKLDRLGRSLKHLMEVIEGLSERRIGFRSLTEGLDTTTSGGKLIFHIFGAIAEFERDLIWERTQAGLKAARARGRVGGRPRKIGPEKERQLKTLALDHDLSVSDICETLGISRDTYYRYLRKSRAS